MSRGSIYEEEHLLLSCQEALALAMSPRGSRARVAKALGIPRSAITKALGSGHNLTLRTLAKMAWAAGFRITVGVRVLPPSRRPTTPEAP